jgi:superoxide reductase
MEKHVPVIECADSVKADELFEVKVTIGKEFAHPNTTEHHISCITLFFLTEGEKFLAQVAQYEFGTHGDPVQGPNTSTVYTHHAVAGWTGKPETLIAVSMCNIHGLWQSSKEIKLKYIPFLTRQWFSFFFLLRLRPDRCLLTPSKRLVLPVVSWVSAQFLMRFLRLFSHNIDEVTQT